METKTISTVNALTNLNKLLEDWDKQQTGTPTCLSRILTQIAELFEREIEGYFKMNPDPFDDRHPGRINPNCSLGHLMKTISKNETFISQLMSECAARPSNRPDQYETTVAACRLLLDLMPGLDINTLFPEGIDGPVLKLYSWVESAEEPLCSYATGLLAHAVSKIQNISTFKEQNIKIVPTLLTRLHELMNADSSNEVETNCRHFEMFASTSDQSASDTLLGNSSSYEGGGGGEQLLRTPLADLSSSSWAEQEPYLIGSSSMFPLTVVMKQRLILQYLTAVVEYQDLLGTVLEHNSLELILDFIDLKKHPDIRLAFDALKYLANMLCHRKFMIEFISLGGVEKLLAVPRPSMAATGVSLCLYYLSYFEDAMERVCLLPMDVLDRVINYALWLMECSHESSRCHAAMFFDHAFIFKVVTKLFDQKKGLRILYNMISTLEIVHSSDSHLSEDKLFTNRQAARHVCTALKKYFECHLCIKAEELRRVHIREYNASPIADAPSYKAVKCSPEMVQENIDLLLELLPLRCIWTPVEEFNKLGGLTLLTKIISEALEWTNCTGRFDTIKYAIDVIAICTLVPRSLQVMVEQIKMPDLSIVQPISVLLNVAQGDGISDPEISKSALTAIINCACGPVDKLSVTATRMLGSSVKKKINSRVADFLSQIWSAIQANDGIMILLKLLNTKTPVTDADSIRILACRALVGLSRCETIRQIISKLPMFKDGQLQQLTKEPILHDRQREHIKYFCKYANELFEQVTGKQQNLMNASLEEIRRADVVAQTKITYEENDLLFLIYDHLLERGYRETALKLHHEANLPARSSTPPLTHPASPHLYSTPSQTSKNPRSALVGGHTESNHPAIACQAGPSNISVNSSEPIRLNLAGSHSMNSPCNHNTPSRVFGTPTPVVRPSKNHTSLFSSNSSRKLPRQHKNGMTLDKLVCDYLRKQHAYCRHPVSTCPKMSLFVPHLCPEPLHKNSAPANITARMFKRSVFPQHAGPNGAKSDRRYVFSRFRSVRVYRSEDDDCYSVCAFSACQDYMILGTFSGDIKIVEISTGEERGNYACHSSVVNNIQPSLDGHMLLSSCIWGKPLSILSSTTESFKKLHSFDDHYMEFSKQVQDRIVGTKDRVAKIYDVETGNQIMKLHDESKLCDYTHNRATFNPTDDLILNDGVLWDVRGNTAIHRFDKFNSKVSGVFHPIDLEIIINTEVWDMRTFHLIHTVPTLDQCRIKFNNSGSILYGVLDQGDEMDTVDDKLRAFYGSIFRTFDATNYNSIATYDVKKNILDLCTDEADRYIALIENQKTEDLSTFDDEEDGVCRLYEVGKLKDAEDDQVDEDEEELALDEDETSRLSGDEGSGDENGNDNNDPSRESDENDTYMISSSSSSSDSSDTSDAPPDEDDDDDDEVILNLSSL